MTYKVISVLGASIANGFFDNGGAGWPARMIVRMQQDKPHGFYLRNFAVSGDRVADCLHRFRGQVAGLPGDCLVIFCGHNDTARFGGRDAAPSLSLPARTGYWDSLLSEARRCLEHVFAVQLTPVNEDKVPARADDHGNAQFYRNDDIAEYNRHIEKACARHGVACITLDGMAALADWNAHLHDDVHPNEKGHAALAEHIYKAVRPALAA